jgi:hypothetical protein
MALAEIELVPFSYFVEDALSTVTFCWRSSHSGSSVESYSHSCEPPVVRL